MTDQEYSKIYYAENKEYFRNRYKQQRERLLALNRAYRKTAAGKISQARSDIRAQLKFPEKRRARRIIEWEIKKGTVQKQPCEKCGLLNNVHAHHEDYSKPLEVVWLCVKHHQERHKELQTQAEVKTVEIL